MPSCAVFIMKAETTFSGFPRLAGKKAIGQIGMARGEESKKRSELFGLGLGVVLTFTNSSSIQHGAR